MVWISTRCTTYVLPLKMCSSHIQQNNATITKLKSCMCHFVLERSDHTFCGHLKAPSNCFLGHQGFPYRGALLRFISTTWVCIIFLVSILFCPWCPYLHYFTCFHLFSFLLTITPITFHTNPSCPVCMTSSTFTLFGYMFAMTPTNFHVISVIVWPNLTTSYWACNCMCQVFARKWKKGNP